MIFFLIAFFLLLLPAGEIFGITCLRSFGPTHVFPLQHHPMLVLLENIMRLTMHSRLESYLNLSSISGGEKLELHWFHDPS